MTAIKIKNRAYIEIFLEIHIRNSFKNYAKSHMENNLKLINAQKQLRNQNLKIWYERKNIKMGAVKSNNDEKLRNQNLNIWYERRNIKMWAGKEQ